MNKSTAIKILITDDEANIRLMLRTALEADGYQISEAANGKVALDAIATGSFDLLLLDLNMPVFDGMSVLEQLRHSPPAHPPRVVVLTAYGSIPTAVRATRLGALDFLEKPITPDELRSTIAAVLREPESAQPEPSEEDAPAGFAGVLDRVRKAIRVGDVPSAESLLVRVADLSGGREAPYFNLLGILYEAQQQWRLSKKFYSKAVKADKHYEPALNNLQRHYELTTFGRTKLPILLGDEEQGTALERLLRQRDSVKLA
jgi:DNA-binding response OmpR family regulator